MTTRNASLFVGGGQLIVEGAHLGDDGSLACSSFAGVHLELVSGSEQGVAGGFGEPPGVLAAAAGDAAGGRFADLDEGVEEPAMDVEGVGHDEGVGEDEADHVPVGHVAVHGHDLDGGPLGAAVETGEGPDGRAVPAGGDVDDHASFGVGEDGGEHERLAHGAFVDGQAPPESPPSGRGGSSSGPAHGQAEVVVGDTQVPGHRGGGPAPGQIGEEGQRPLRGAAPADALEAFVEGPLRTGVVGADEPAHAHRQGDHQRADHVDDVPPPRPVGVDRRMGTARAQRRRVPPGDMDQWSFPGPVNRAEHVHVPAPQAQVDTVGHGPRLLCLDSRKNRSLGAGAIQVVDPLHLKRTPLQPLFTERAESAFDQRVWYAPRDSNPEPAD
jgi:hypothetical protein